MVHQSLWKMAAHDARRFRALLLRRAVTELHSPLLLTTIAVAECSVGAELAAMAPQRIMQTAGEEPEGQEPEPPRGTRQAVGRQWLVVLRHGQRIDEAGSYAATSEARVTCS